MIAPLQKLTSNPSKLHTQILAQLQGWDLARASQPRKRQFLLHQLLGPHNWPQAKFVP